MPPVESSPTGLLRPRYWAVHVIALALTATAVTLGLWQYQSWEQRRADEARDLTGVAAIALSDAIGPDDPFPSKYVGQPVEVAGTWLPDSTLYISGRPGPEDRDGYWVMTPVQVDATGSALLVVRGWIQDPADAPPPPTGETRMVAWLQPGEGNGSVDQDPTDDVLPQVRLADAIQHVDVDLYGAYGIEADPSAYDGAAADAVVNPGNEGLVAASLDQLPEVGKFTAIRNLLYGLEWWFFAAFALFVWVRWLRDLLVEPDDEPSREQSVG